MANESGMTTVWNCPNYVGELFMVGANLTPFLNMIGGLSGDNIRTVGAFDFPLAVHYSLASASQPAISETASTSAGTATTYGRGQDLNTVQIFQRAVEVTYAKRSSYAAISGVSLNGEPQPMQDELDFQIAANLEQIASDVEYTFLRGSYQQATSEATAAKNRGLLEACATNTVDASSAALSKELMDQLLRTMADNGARFREMVVLAGSLQKQRLSDIYGYAPEHRNVGGVNIKQIETDFAPVGVVWAPKMPSDALVVADLSVCRPVFLPVPEKGLLFYEPLSRDGAAEKGHVYGQIGLDYGPEEFHGKLTNLAST